MSRTRVDPSLARDYEEGFAFPLGVRSLEPCEPAQGYHAGFEAADGGSADDDWEEWPDRYVYEVVLTAERLPALCRALFALLPLRVYPILDVLGNDAYRDVDPYIAYEPVGLDVFLEGVRRFGDWFYEDGMVGFGAMSEEPFVYIAVDEHKVVTVRAGLESHGLVEQALAAFGLSRVEEPRGVDAVPHEHRGVLLAPPDRRDLLTADEALEDLQDAWRLELNIDTGSNVDDDGRQLGVTGWRCLVRLFVRGDQSARDVARYAEVLLVADSFAAAEELAVGAAVASAEGFLPPGWQETLDARVLQGDRVRPEGYGSLCCAAGVASSSSPGVAHLRWLEGGA